LTALSNPKHEKFCQLRFKGKSQEEAYRLAGYKPDPGAASRLSRNVGVQNRLKELHIAALNKVEVTVESMAAQFDEDRRLAIEMKQMSAAHAASNSKAKLYGLFVEKSTVNVTHSYATMTEEELRFEIAAITAEARSLKPGVQH
jgi:hypothetical protein